MVDVLGKEKIPQSFVRLIVTERSRAITIRTHARTRASHTLSLTHLSTPSNDALFFETVLNRMSIKNGQ
jgi:hypothetical protein